MLENFAVESRRIESNDALAFQVQLNSPVSDASDFRNESPFDSLEESFNETNPQAFFVEFPQDALPSGNELTFTGVVFEPNSALYQDANSTSTGSVIVSLVIASETGQISELSEPIDLFFEATQV